MHTHLKPSWHTTTHCFDAHMFRLEPLTIPSQSPPLAPQNANGYTAMQCFIRDHSVKPFTRGETFGAVVASTMVDCSAQLIIVLSQDGYAARYVAKYRPAVPQVCAMICGMCYVELQACVKIWGARSRCVRLPGCLKGSNSVVLVRALLANHRPAVPQVQTG